MLLGFILRIATNSAPYILNYSLIAFASLTSPRRVFYIMFPACVYNVLIIKFTATQAIYECDPIKASTQT